MSDSYDVLVVGAGPAGVRAALRAAELGARVVVVDPDRPGGTCVNTGCVPTRVLAAAARLVRDVRAAQGYGVVVHGYDVDWERTVARVRATVERVREAKADADRLRDAGVDLVRGRARFVDPHEVELSPGGRRLRADQVILCVGGHSRRLPVPGAELATLPEHVLDLPRVPRRVAVVGAGNTGAQLVTVFNALGSEVTLLEVAPRILAHTDADVSAAVEQAFAEQGVSVVTGVEAVVGLVRSDDGIDLTWRVGGRERSTRVDEVVMATGWPAAVEDLDLPAAGLDTERGHIPVDEHLRTRVPHIFAVGDANGRAMLVQAAHAEAEAAATTAVLGTPERAPHRLLPSGGFTDPDYADVGLTEEQAREEHGDCLVARVPYATLERALIDDLPRGFLKLVADRDGARILGAHAVGENAVEVIQAVTTAMAAGADAATLAQVEFAYPTYTAAVGAAARMLVEEASLSPLTAGG